MFIRGRRAGTSVKNNCLAAVASLVFISASALPATAEPLVFSGSTTVQKRILEPAKAAIEKKTGVSIEIKGSGTIKGMRDLIRDEASAAMLSTPLDMVSREAGLPGEETYEEHVIMKDVIVPIVHPMNPVKTLTLEQLADINAGRITNWKEVGGRDQRIVVVAPPRSSGTRLFLQERVMNGSDFASKAFVAITTQEEIDLIARSSIAIGALSKGFVKLHPGRVKVVKTPPIVRQLSIATKGEPSDELLAVIKYLKSSQAKKYFK